MRTLSYISKFFMWFILVFYFFIQALTVFALISNNQNALEAGRSDSIYSVVPLISATLMMVLGVILFVVFNKRRYIGIIIAGVAAAVMLVVALDMGRNFPASIGVGETDVGLSTWKIIWRHIGIAIIPVFMLGAWLSERYADKVDLQRRADKPGYNLTGNAIFKDVDSESFAQPEQRKLNRSLKKRLEKQ